MNLKMLVIILPLYQLFTLGILCFVITSDLVRILIYEAFVSVLLNMKSVELKMLNVCDLIARVSECKAIA